MDRWINTWENEWENKWEINWSGSEEWDNELWEKIQITKENIIKYSLINW